MRYTVCAVTGTRAEFGLLEPLLQRLYQDEEIQLCLAVTGSHLSQSFGNTQEEIVKSGLPIHARIPIPLNGDTKADMAKATGEATIAFTDYFVNSRPDVLIVLGDRYEIFGAATAAALLGIPIAHIHGGEITEGAVDDFLRHSITKMSTLHFTACEEYRGRVIQLGENPETVFNVGALGVENIKRLQEVPKKELDDCLNLNLEASDYAVVTFHPVTREEGTAEEQVQQLIAAMDRYPEMAFVITKANADAGGRAINHIWSKEALRHTNWRLTASLGAKKYLTVLKYAKMMIGNSSSGILEAPAMKVPTINIGNRQKGRFMAESIISCEPVAEDICNAIKRALTEEFREIVQRTRCPFGDGDTSEKILTVIKDFLRDPEKPDRKEFYDITF